MHAPATSTVVGAFLMLDQFSISELERQDQERWSELWTEYLRFYDTSLPPGTYKRTWQRILTKSGTLRGLCIRERDSQRAVGITHFFLHETAWTDRPVCYLQDLYVDQQVRGKGLGRRLIGAVADFARDQDCYRLYWLTQEGNHTARTLYDKVAAYEGFIRYDHRLR